MPPNNLRRLIAEFIDFIRFTLNRLRKLFSDSFLRKVKQEIWLASFYSVQLIRTELKG